TASPRLIRCSCRSDLMTSTLSISAPSRDGAALAWDMLANIRQKTANSQRIGTSWIMTASDLSALAAWRAPIYEACREGLPHPVMEPHSRGGVIARKAGADRPYPRMIMAGAPHGDFRPLRLGRVRAFVP